MEPPPQRGWFDLWRTVDSHLARSARQGSYIVDAVARRRARQREPSTGSRRRECQEPSNTIDGDTDEGVGRAARGPPIELWHVVVLGIVFLLFPELLCFAYWVIAIAIAIRSTWLVRRELAARSQESD